MARVGINHNPKTQQGEYRLKRIREKAKRKGDLKQPPTEQCLYDPRFKCNPEACPPIRERMANLRTTGEMRPCKKTIPAE